MGARSACGFCSDLALCSVRAEREESERECVRACVVCVRMPVGARVWGPSCLWVVLPLSSSLWKGLPVFPCFFKCRTWPFLSGIPLQASSQFPFLPCPHTRLCVQLGESGAHSRARLPWCLVTAPRRAGIWL